MISLVYTKSILEKMDRKVDLKVSLLNSCVLQVNRKALWYGVRIRSISLETCECALVSFACTAGKMASFEPIMIYYYRKLCFLLCLS